MLQNPSKNLRGTRRCFINQNCGLIFEREKSLTLCTKQFLFLWEIDSQNRRIIGKKRLQYPNDLIYHPSRILSKIKNKKSARHKLLNLLSKFFLSSKIKGIHTKITHIPFFFRLEKWKFNMISKKFNR